MITPESVSTAHHLEIHIFCDASEQAISSVAYLKSVNETGNASLGFLMGKTKLAPLKGLTIPRLELCAAVLDAELGEVICDNMKLLPETCHYYTDSQVVLGYISNTKRRFFTYVTNRVEKIHKTSNPSQWSYISTDQNPADAGTRFSSSPDMILVTRWITGIPAICVEDRTLKTFLNEKGTVWKFNTPYSSHMGGSWERLIGIARRIIDSILYDARHNKLTHEVLCTFMAETTAIMNSRPLIPISSDPDSPCVLSPNALLTTKTIDCDEDFSHLNIRDVYTTQWKFVQVLAGSFGLSGVASTYKRCNLDENGNKLRRTLKKVIPLFSRMVINTETFGQ